MTRMRYAHAEPALPRSRARGRCKSPLRYTLPEYIFTRLHRSSHRQPQVGGYLSRRGRDAGQSRARQRSRRQQQACASVQRRKQAAFIQAGGGTGRTGDRMAVAQAAVLHKPRGAAQRCRRQRLRQRARRQQGALHGSAQRRQRREAEEEECRRHAGRHAAETRRLQNSSMHETGARGREQ